MTPPAKVVVITGAIGGGHHAAARAVAERVHERWPSAEVVVADVLAGMGRGVGPAFAGIFTACLRWAGWLYGLHFQLLWRLPFYRGGARTVLGRWSARPIARLLERERPDLVVTTFPEAATGLGRLRRAGRLPMPAAVLVADVAPHPLWCDAALDAHWVATDGGVDLVRRAAPGATARVVGPPVVRAFHPAPRPERVHPRAMVSCGSLAFGDVVAVCAGVLDAGVDVEVTSARRPELRRRLDRLAIEHPRGTRMNVRDWFDDPAATTRDADLVVTTGASATAHEALAGARPLVIVTPIPGHGRAGAHLLARAGLARVCGLGDLSRTVRAALADRVSPPGGDLLGEALADLAEGSAPVAEQVVERVRGEDALFLHAATARTPQQLGARLTLADTSVSGTIGPQAGRDWPATLSALVAERGAEVPLLARRLDPPRFGRPPRWRHVAPDAARHVRPEVLRWGPGTPWSDLDAATSAALATRIDPVADGWALQVVLGPDPGAEVVVVAVAHHALGDGLAITDALCRLLTDEEGALGRASRSPAPPRDAVLANGDRRPFYRAMVPVVQKTTRAAAGIAALATDGPAGPSTLTGTGGSTPARHLTLTWDGARVRATARAHGVSTTVLVLSVVAEALSHHLRPHGDLRAMVPVTERTRAAGATTAIGNRTAALPVLLPTAPMSVARRLATVDAAFGAAASSARPTGSAAVLALLGRLPWRLYARLGRRLYGARFLHLLVSVMPGRRRRIHVGGALVREVHPLLPLADGVGLAIGAMNWASTLGVGVTVDPDLVPDPDGLRDRLDDALYRIELCPIQLCPIRQGRTEDDRAAESDNAG